MHSKNLAALSNNDLVARLRQLEEVERSNLVEFVFLLAEMARRDHHLALGYSSLFTYCSEGLGLEKSYAYRRSTAAHLVNRFSIAGDYLRDGRLSLTTLVPLRKVLTSQNCQQVLDRAVGLSEEKVKRLVASLAPGKVTATVVRAIPTRVVDVSEFS